MQHKNIKSSIPHQKVNVNIEMEKRPHSELVFPPWRGGQSGRNIAYSIPPQVYVLNLIIYIYNLYTSYNHRSKLSSLSLSILSLLPLPLLSHHSYSNKHWHHLLKDGKIPPPAHPNLLHPFAIPMFSYHNVKDLNY